MFRLSMLLLVGALALAGCQNGTRGVSDFITSAAAPITNPVTPTNIYQVKLTFDLAAKASNKWADFCWSKGYKAILADPVGKYACVNRRATKRALYTAATRANAAISAANKFIIANPTLSPLDAVAGAWSAVSDYKRMIDPIAP